MAGFQQKSVDMRGIPSNYLNVVNTDYYIPSSLEEDAVTSTLPDGKPNVTSMLYNDIGIQPWPKDNKDIYSVTTPQGSYNPDDVWTEEIKVLMSANMKPMASINAGDTARLCNYKYCEAVYRMKVRGLITKLPGFLFTAYKNPILTPEVVTSMEQMKNMVDQFWIMNPTFKENFDKKYDNYDFIDGLPKQMLFVKLIPNCTQENRLFIANGIRALFRDQVTLFMDTVELVDQLKSTMVVFDIFIGLIALISLTLTFFLLLVSTRQNVRDNIWEYGVLRSMGFTKAQGQRLYMYESFLVVFSSCILGVGIGILTSILVTAQFYLFLELPLVVEPPWALISLILGVCISTTFFAVCIPVR